MHRQPAAIDGEFHAAAIFRRTAAIAKQKRLVDLLNVDAALNRLDQVSDFEDSPRGFLRVGVGAGGGGISCSSLVFLVRAARNNPDRVVGQGPLQRLGLIPRRAHPDVALLIGRQDHRHRLRMDRLDDRVRRRRQEAAAAEVRAGAFCCP